MPFKKKEHKEGELIEIKYTYPLTGLNNIKGHLNRLIENINTPPNVVSKAIDRLILLSVKDEHTREVIESIFLNEGKKLKIIETEVEKDNNSTIADGMLALLNKVDNNVV